ncbi:MAG: DUF3853 family protein [Mangrovibacterium sp.]
MFNQDFISELAAAVAENVIRQIADNKNQTVQQRIKIRGIRGIAAHLGCSTRTAQNLKDSGLFPTYWVGKNLYAYSDEIEEGLKKNGRA